MASSKTEIVNIALSHLGVGSEIYNLDTDQSTEANAMRRFYESAKDEVLRDLNWPFSTVFASLALVEEDPTEEWSYSYRYPSDALKIRRVLSGLRNDTRQSRVPYKLGQDSSGLLLYCDIENAEIEYTKREDDTSLYPVDFTLALSYKLAFYTAPRLTKGDPFGLANRAMQMYNVTIAKAANNALNEEQVEENPDSEFIRSRE
jgi:hypothetical protein